MNKKTKFLLIGIAAIIIISLFILFFEKGNVLIGKTIDNTNNYSKFVNCLNENGFILYGFGENDLINTQLNLFENAKGSVNYTDCSLHQQKCNNIVVYPSWETNKGIIASGLSLGMLSSLSDCKLN
jgi:hypothetical protein